MSFSGVSFHDYATSSGGIYNDIDLRVDQVLRGGYTIVRNVAAFCAVAAFIITIILMVYAAFGDNRTMAEAKKHIIHLIAAIIFVFGLISIIVVIASALPTDL